MAHPGSSKDGPRRKTARDDLVDFKAQIRGEKNELRKKLLLIGFLTDVLSKEGETVFLVGGQAVETYTAGQFTTGDIDVTTTDQEATEKVLSRIGFKRVGLVWLNEALGLAVHIVASFPSRSEKARTIKVAQYRVKVIGIEELIIDRLKAAKFWKSERDEEQALVLFASFKSSIDLEYLKRRASEEKVDDVLPKGV